MTCRTDDDVCGSDFSKFDGAREEYFGIGALGARDYRGNRPECHSR